MHLHRGVERRFVEQSVLVHIRLLGKFAETLHRDVSQLLVCDLLFPVCFRCEILNVNILLSKRVSAVRKVSWLPLGPNNAEFSANILGVLYSNSVVR
jgi:hypothetical protein